MFVIKLLTASRTDLTSALFQVEISNNDFTVINTCIYIFI